MPKVLVYGWYGDNGNLGDTLFKEAYPHLFPDFDFVFTDHISLAQLEDIDAVFFGGGSFLLDAPQIIPTALQTLKDKPIFYLGIGVEPNIHYLHVELMTQARMIATRSPDQIDRLRLINPNVFFLPDLVYSLQDKVLLSTKIPNSVLILPNISVVPQSSDPHWKHAAWDYFKSEFVQFLDWLVEEDYQPALFSMCRGEEITDDWIMAELIGRMSHRHQKYVQPLRPVGIQATTALFSGYETVITQRFHGIVLSEMIRTPYLAIHHHDKLRFCQPNEGTFLSYYGLYKQAMIDAFKQTNKMRFNSPLPVDPTIFSTFTQEVRKLL